MLGYNPHLHILCADGGFGERSIFYAAAAGLDIHKNLLLDPPYINNIFSEVFA
jgi:hypothetical protein